MTNAWGTGDGCLSEHRGPSFTPATSAQNVEVLSRLWTLPSTHPAASSRTALRDQRRVGHGAVRASLARARAPRRGPAARTRASARCRRLRCRTRRLPFTPSFPVPSAFGRPRRRENDRSTDCAPAPAPQMRSADPVHAGVHQWAGYRADRSVVYSFVLAAHGSGRVGHAVPVDLDRRRRWAPARVLLRRPDGRPDVRQWIGFGRVSRF